MDDLISRKAAIDAINHICPVDTEYDCTLLDRVDVRCVLSDLPSAQSELSDEEKRLYKKLRSYHNESYAKLLDKMMASVQPEIVRCKYCKCWDDDQMYCVDFMTQDENGFCSWWDKKEVSPMLTSIGRFLKKLRIDRGEILKDMAEKLDVTVSFLSAVENGKKHMPSAWNGKICRLYDLNEEQRREFTTAIAETEESAQNVPNDDLISRKTAIDAIRELESGEDFNFNNGLICAMNNVAELPSVQPERKKGKWIRNDNGTYSCSVCQSWIPEEQHYYARYCLYCGAKMEVKKHGGPDKGYDPGGADES